MADQNWAVNIRFFFFCCTAATFGSPQGHNKLLHNTYLTKGSFCSGTGGKTMLLHRPGRQRREMVHLRQSN